MQNIFHTPDYSPQNLSALMPKSHNVEAPRNRSLPTAAPLGARHYTPSRVAWFQLNRKTRREDRAMRSAPHDAKGDCRLVADSLLWQDL
jgi:hypothetical protein